MAKLKLLENLDLTRNNLCEIPNEICELKALKTLKLGHNKLMALPDDMYYLTDLRTVQIDHNLFNNKPPQYDLMKGVVSFNMSSNPMNDHRSKVRERLLVASTAALYSLAASLVAACPPGRPHQAGFQCREQARHEEG